MSFRINYIVFLTFISALLQFNALFAQTTRYVPLVYSTINAAITAASNGDTIDITGTFTEAQINITKSLVIKGHGTTVTVIKNSTGTTAVFNVTAGNSIIKNMTVQNGRYGVTVNSANLTISDCDISRNNFNGIFSSTNLSAFTLNLIKSSICNNGGGNGPGGIYNANRGNLIISSCNISNNINGGIYNTNFATCSIINSIISYNSINKSSSKSGAGIYIMTGTCTINNSIISNNSLSGGRDDYGAGIFNKGTLLINSCTINNNIILGATATTSRGGGAGIFNELNCTINNCTINNNLITDGRYSVAGGGICNCNKGNCSINNSTISNNIISNAGTQVNGGGIYNNNYCTINNCTISGNNISQNDTNKTPQGGGIYIDSISSGTITIIKNSILANNIVQGILNKDLSGTITSYGYNLYGQSSVSGSVSTDLIGLNPLLDSLNYNGGPTKTMALLNGSPAIDAASKIDIYGNMVLYDQRNYKRYNINDIGAFESNNSVQQITDNICSNFQDQAIIKIMLYSVDTATVTSFTFNTSGTTDPSEILSARLYYTGTSATFSTANPFGQTYLTPSGAFTIFDSIRIRGINNFWLAYNILDTVQPGHNFDASATQIHIDTFALIPDITSPVGYRTIHIVRAAFEINDSAQCITGNHFIFTNKSTTSSDTLTNHWYFGDGFDSATVLASHHYLLPDTFGVKLVVNTADGCADSIVKKVIVFPAPITKFNVNDSTQCLKGNSFVFINKTSNDTGKLSYKWDFGDLTSSVLLNPSHSYSKSDTFVVTLTSTSFPACSSSAVTHMIVYPQPVTKIIVNDTTLCFKENLFSFQPAIINPLSKFLWTFGDGTNDINSNTKHHYNSTGLFDVILSETSQYGCIDSVQQIINVLENPNAAISVNDTDQCLSGNLFVFNSIGTPAMKSYQWIFGDGHTGNGATTSHSYSISDTFNIKLIATNNQGCTDTATNQIILYPRLHADFTVNDSSQCLDGNSFIFNNKSDAKAVFFEWSFGDGNNSGISSPVHNYLSAYQFSVKLKVFSADICTDSLIKLITVKPNPQPPTVSSNSPVCLGSEINLFAQSPVNVSYSWNSDNGFKSLLQNPVITISTLTDSGEYHVKCIQNGCESPEAVIDILVLPLPAVNLGKDGVICQGDSVRLDAGNFSSYLWQDNSNSRTYVVYDDGTYFVTATDENKCKNTDTIEFISRCPTNVFIPNAFSPNDDNINETFRIVISNITEFHLIIFSRWGDEIFTSNDSAVMWDGKYKGAICPVGYYFYELNYKEELGLIKVVNGSVLLLR